MSLAAFKEEYSALAGALQLDEKFPNRAFVEAVSLCDLPGKEPSGNHLATSLSLRTL